MLYIRYLTLPIGLCLGFLPPTPDSSRRSHLRRLWRETSSVRLDVSKRCSVNENNDADHKHDGLFVAVKSTPVGATSRRNALETSSSAVATMLAAATTAEASTISDGVAHQPDHGIATKEKLPPLLESSSLYQVQTGSSTNTQRRPSVKKILKKQLLNNLKSRRAVFLGENHPEGRDHRLQAALIRSLHDSIRGNGSSTNAAAAPTGNLAVGLEAFQWQFQPLLDQYSAGAINEEDLRRMTEWDSRWYWSFEAYRPIFQTCRELDIPLLALDISTEDRLLVESGGLEALDPETLRRYIPDRDKFSAFGSTLAYQLFLSYTLKPLYELQQRTRLGNQAKNSMPYSNFVARQMVRDEAMASAAQGWLSKNPDGILVGCIGINHATFGCGVSGRLEQKLSTVAANDPNRREQQRRVSSVLINPQPLNTGTELKICKTKGQPPEIDEEDDDYVRARRLVFLPNNRNQICIENSVELQNYALQVDYIPLSDLLEARQTAMNEAAMAMQTIKGETTLGLSDYLVFSPKEQT